MTDMSSMEITEFFFSRRENALLAGDYNAYRAQSSRRVHTVRKKLNQTTPKGRKYTARPPISAENVGSNQEYIHLLLLSAERAWAQAMQMKSVHSGDASAKGIVGPTRRHIITRLNKATQYAKQLVQAVEDKQISQATDVDVLEARAYQALLAGSLWIEKQRWDESLRNFAIARVVYSALGQRQRKDSYRDLISATIDPSIRYAAYQLKLPRTKALSSLAIENFPSDGPLRSEVEAIDPTCLNEDTGVKTKSADGTTRPLPETIQWRSRSVPIEDASIAQALAETYEAEARLSSWLKSAEGQSASSKDKASAYDDVIQASQEAVDAAKTAIDELVGEGVDRGDRRMQALQVTRTAVNYALVGWRIGRNRVLCGDQDGLLFDAETHPATRKRRRGAQSLDTARQEGPGKKIAKLRERVALYDATLQSLEFIQELPGVAGDSSLVQELDSKRHYFQALRCLAIGRSHSFLEKSKNALALFARASELANDIQGKISSNASIGEAPNLEISKEQIEALTSTSKALVTKFHGLVTLESLSGTTKGKSTVQPPLIERMEEYDTGGTNLSNLVPFPPKLEAIPVKPLFLDVAWNYIKYPRESRHEMENTPTEEKKEGRRGWFGFGR